MSDGNCTEAVQNERHREKGGIRALTGLRFLAALSVVLAHGAAMTLRFDSSSLGPVFWMGQGAAFGMTLFFVLSGFVIHYNYRTLVAHGGLGAIATFLWARFARLYPLFLLILLIDVMLGRELYNFMLGDGASFEPTLHALPWYLLLLQSWVYRIAGEHALIYAFGNNMWLTWSISTECFFYVAYIFLARMLFGRPWIILAATMLWIVLWWTMQLTVRSYSAQIDAWATVTYGPGAGFAEHARDSFFVWLIYFSPYSRIGEFILGALSAQLYLQLIGRKVTRDENVAGQALLTISVVSCGILVGERNFSPFLAAYFVPDFGPAPFVAAIIFCVSRYGGWVTGVLSSRPLVALGEASYSIYLIHFLIFYLPFGYNQMPLTAEPINVVFLWIRFSFLVALIFLLSLGLHAYFELPTRQWLRRCWSRWQRSGYRLAAGVVPGALLAGPVALALIIHSVKAPNPMLRSKDAVGIQVTSATYGQNCGVAAGNATRRLSLACDGNANCKYKVDASTIGDPASGCLKEFSASYMCLPGGTMRRASLPGEAGLGSVLLLECSTPAGTDLPLK